MEEGYTRIYPYDAIRSNHRRVYLGAAVFLMVVFLEVFIISLASLGTELFDAWNMAVPVLITAGISLLLLPVLYVWAYYRAQGIVLKLFKEHEPDPLEKERVIHALEGVCVACGTSTKSIFFSDSQGVNAITLNRGRDDALIVLSRGAVEDLDRFELEALLAHEVYHTVSRDTWFWTLGIAVSAMIPLLLSDFSYAETDFRDMEGEEVLDQLEPELNWKDLLGTRWQIVLSAFWLPLWMGFYWLVLPESRDALADRARWTIDFFDTHVPLPERIETVRRMS